MYPRSVYDSAVEYENNWLADATVGTIQWGASAVTDLGVSIYNSIVPESYETSTYNVLADMNADLANFYAQNKTAVEVGSFIGGLIIPGFGVAKAAKAAAMGSGGLFGSIGKLAGLGYSGRKIQHYTKQAAELAAKANTDTTSLKSALWKQRLWTMEHSLAENVIFETAFYGLMNDHTFMDNYGLDTFFYSTVLGTAITSPINLAINNKSYKDAAFALQIGNIEKAGGENIFAVSGKALARQYTPGTAMAGMWYSVDNLKQIAAGLSDPADAEIKHLVHTNAGQQEVFARQMLETTLTPDLQAISAAYKQNIKNPTNQWWSELRPQGESTPLQMLGYFSRKNPLAMEGVVKGGVGKAQSSIHAGNYFDASKPHDIGNPIYADEMSKAHTYDEALEYFGGETFKERTDLVHVYQWDGEVYAASAVHGRLLRGAAEAGLEIDPKYPMAAQARTYDPLNMPTHEADIEFLNALYVSRDTLSLPGEIDYLDLPRLQAAVVSGQGAKIARYNRKGQKVVDDLGVNDTKQRYRFAKMRWIADMMTRGFDNHLISKATNTPLETIQAVQHAGANDKAIMALSKSDDVRWHVYTQQDKNYINNQLKPTMLQARLSEFGNNPWAKAVSHDTAFMADTTRAVTDNIVMRSRSPMLRKIYDTVINTGTNRIFEQEAYQLFATGAHGSNWTSTDFYFRAWEQFNAHLITAGQDFERVVNDHGIAPMLNRMQPLAEAVASDGKVAIVNFEQARNALDAIPSSASTANMRYSSNNRKIILKDSSDPDKVTYLKIPGTNQDWVAEFDSVHALFEQGIHPAGNALWEMRTTNSHLLNINAGSRRGIHIPYDNISNDFVSFIIDTKNPQNIQRISGNNLAQMEEKVKTIRSQIAGTNFEIVPRDELDKVWNQLNDYSSLQYLQEANPDFFKSGIPSQEVTGSVDVLNNLLKAYESDILKQARIFNRVGNSNVFDTLQQLAHYHDSLALSSRGTSAQKLQRTSNPADLASKTLLNISKVGYSPFMRAANNATDIAINWTAQKVKRGWESIGARLKQGKNPTQAEFDELTQQLSAHNIPNPWKDLHEFIQAQLPKDKQQSKSLVSASSQVMTLFNLRLLDTAHAIVTTLSAPALLAGEGAMHTSDPFKMMMKVGKYFWNDAKRPDVQKRREIMEARGYGARRTSEATTLLNKAIASKGFLKELSDTDAKTLKDLIGEVKANPSSETIGKAAYKAFTRPSDWAEETTREFAYLMGYEISLQRAPKAAESTHQAFANLFTNRAMGNYTARQRPMMFQGSFGQAMGLYQTFMFTVGQNFLRMVEGKNVAALGKFGGVYTGMFGLEALPFYNDINQMIGTWSNAPDHQDITQTLYEAFGDRYNGHERTVAQYLLYGAPSTLFQSAWYTRGDLDPRAPIDKGRLAPPVVTALADIWTTTTQAGGNAWSLAKADAPITDIGRAMTEGVMMQTMWRPAARLTEVGMGYTVDRKGQILSQKEEVRNSWHPIFARISGARPLKEAVLRQQRYYNRFYDTADSQRRRKSIRALRTHLRGTENSAVVGNIMQSYLDDGGSPTGWSAILNQTYLGTEQPFADKLIDQISQQESMLGIVEGYAY